MRVLLFAITTLLLLAHCDKEPINSETTTWSVTEDSLTIEKVFIINADHLTLTIDRASLCPNQDVQIRVFVDDQEEFNQTAYEYLQDIQINLPNVDAKVRVITSAVVNNSSVICVWMGAVNVTLNY